MKKVWLYALVLTVSTAEGFSQTTTVTAETSNNTSASSSFPGLTDFRTTDPTTTPSPWTLGAAIETDTFDMSPANVSRVNVHNLMDPSFTGKILVETQTWFCNQSPLGSYTKNYTTTNSHTFTECGPHLDVGYDSNDQVHANRAVDEMFFRGFDGFMADTSGGAMDCRTGGPSGTPLSFTFTSACPAKIQLVDGAIGKMMTAVDQNHPNQMVFFLAEDQSAFDGQENCQTTDANQALCIAQKIESDISYYNLSYFFPSPNNNAYLKNSDGSAMIAFFIAEEHQGINSTTNLPNNPIDLSQCDSGPSACIFENGTTCGGTFVNSNNATVSNCWTSIWNAVRANAPVPLTMLFRNAVGFTHAQSDGAYAWVDPNPATGTAITTTTQEDWKNTFPNSTSNELDSFYAAAECTRPGGTCAGKLVFGIAKKGFDREDAPFQDLGLGHVTAQQCGQVWLESFAEPFASGHFNATNPIPFMLVGTWDDYEEGTEIETGIFDCHSLGLGGETGLIRWDLRPTATSGPNPQPNTIHHYAVYSSVDGQNLSLIQDNIACPSGSNCSLDVLPLATNLPNGTYTFFVKAVGQPSLSNHLGQITQTLKDFAVHFTESGTSPFDVFVSSRPGNSDSFNLTGSSNIPGFSINTPTVTVGAIASVTANIPPGEGTWHIGITATDTRTGGTDSINFDLTVLGDPSFSVPFSPTSATVTAGSSTSFTATESSTSGFTAPVTLSASGVPAGATASFNPSTIYGGSGSSQATIATSSSTPAGTYAITISASDGGYTQNQTFTLTVNSPPPPPTGGGGGTCTGSRCINQ